MPSDRVGRNTTSIEQSVQETVSQDNLLQKTEVISRLSLVDLKTA